jgi:hypothetical protein
MGSVNVEASQWRLVEVGRVVTHVGGKFDKRNSVIVEIIDHKRVRLHPGESAGGILEEIGGMREKKVQELRLT